MVNIERQLGTEHTEKSNLSIELTGARVEGRAAIKVIFLVALSGQVCLIGQK